VSDELARALERRSIRFRQVLIAAAAALALLLALRTSPDLGVIAVAGAAAVVTFVLALALSCLDVRSRSRSAAAIAPRRHVRSAERALVRLARSAERGAAESRATRPPLWVLDLAPEAPEIRELARLLRTHAEPTCARVAACDRFADLCWNAALRGLDREALRRELGRVRFVLLQDARRA
jgi:hypothetical protein